MDDTDKREQERQSELDAANMARRRKVKAKASVPSELDTVRAKAGAGDAVTATWSDAARKAAAEARRAHKKADEDAVRISNHAHAMSERANESKLPEDHQKAYEAHTEADLAHTDAAKLAREAGNHNAWIRHHDIAEGHFAKGQEHIEAGKDYSKASDASSPASVQASDDPNAVHCRAEASVALSAAEPWKQDEPVRFIYAPAGVHTITAGFREGRITMTVVVDEETPSALQASFKSVAGRRSQTPFADEEHEAHKATLRFPKDGTEFGWGTVKDSTGVVLAGGLPTSYGAEAVNGRTYESWSPEFLTDADYAKARVSEDGHYTFPNGVRGSAANPARLVGVGFTIGALTNKPAFHMMPPVKAGDAAKATDGEVKATWSDAARRAALEARRVKWWHVTKAWRGNPNAKTASILAGYDPKEIEDKIEKQDPDWYVHHIREAKEHELPDPEEMEWREKRLHLESSDKSNIDSVQAASHGLGFCKLAGLAAGLQVAHWAADTVTNAHKAIGDLYETVSAKVDEFAEVYSGKTGEVPLAGEAFEVRAVGDHTALVEDGLRTVEAVKGSLTAGSDDDLLNILADIEAAYNKARYLLKASDGGDAVVLADKGRGDTVTASTILESLSGRRSEAVLAKLSAKKEPPKPKPTSGEILARLGQTVARPNN